MDWGNEEKKPAKTGSNGGKLNLEAIIYMAKKRNMKLTISFLDGYKEENKYSDKEGTPRHKKKFTVHSVEGFDRKVDCAKKLKSYEKKDISGKPTGEIAFSYDSDKFGIFCDHCTEMEASRDPKNNNIATKSQKGIEIYVPVIVWKAEYDMTVPKEEGSDETKTIRVEDELNAEGIVAIPIGDHFFSSAKSGVGKSLQKLFASGRLAKCKLVWTYGELIALTKTDKEGNDIIVKLSKEEQALLDDLRANLDWDKYLPLLPMTYADYHKERYEEEYKDPYDPKNRKKNSSNGKPAATAPKKETAAVGASTNSNSSSESEPDEDDIPPF